MKGQGNKDYSYCCLKNETNLVVNCLGLKEECLEVLPSDVEGKMQKICDKCAELIEVCLYFIFCSFCYFFLVDYFAKLFLFSFLLFIFSCLFTFVFLLKQ